jgi:putative transposase
MRCAPALAMRKRPKTNRSTASKKNVGELVVDIDILEGGEQGPPFRGEDVRRVRQALPRASERRVCRLLDVPRSSMRSAPLEKRPRRPLDAVLVERIRELIRRHPTFGYRKLGALLRYTDGLIVNLKAVYRILKAKRWFVHQRSVTPRPRVQGRRSVAPASNSRRAMDLTHIYCGEDGWGHLAAIIDCCDREIVGWEFSPRGRAREAERALEETCLHRFGTLRPDRPTPVIRSDSGLIFTARRFRAACRDYRVRQEFITRYTPEQDGMIERFFRSLKEECIWQHNFAGIIEARTAITQWIRWYIEHRPHQALGYLSPQQYRAEQLQAVA